GKTPAKKNGNEQKKHKKKAGERAAPPINSKKGKPTEPRRQVEANRCTGPHSDQAAAESSGNADFVRATHRRRNPLLQPPFGRRHAARTRCHAARWRGDSHLGTHQ